MITMIVLTVLALPLALTAAQIGRRRWIRKRSVARVRAELAWFHEDLSSGRHRFRRPAER